LSTASFISSTPCTESSIINIMALVSSFALLLSESCWFNDYTHCLVASTNC
jgi:hypothetical protein